MENDLGPVGQLGYVVNDLETAAWDWFQRTGIGPWTVIPHVALDYFNYRGKPSPVEMGIAMAFSGSMQIELIQQHNDAPSMYRDFLEVSGEGLQHVCFYPKNYDSALEFLGEKGMENIQDGAIRGMRFAYLAEDSGQVLEVGDIPDSVRANREKNIVATQKWDGTNPVRVY